MFCVVSAWRKLRLTAGLVYLGPEDPRLFRMPGGEVMMLYTSRRLGGMGTPKIHGKLAIYSDLTGFYSDLMGY